MHAVTLSAPNWLVSPTHAAHIHEQSMNHISLKKNWPRCHCKSPTVQDAFRPILGLISHAGVTGRCYLMYKMQSDSWPYSCTQTHARMHAHPHTHTHTQFVFFWPWDHLGRRLLPEQCNPPSPLHLTKCCPRTGIELGSSTLSCMSHLRVTICSPL